MGNARNNCSARTIAAKAGVSAMLVSAVLGGNDGKKGTARFSEETARRIREIARKEGYVPNRLAKALIGKETFAIGVLSPFGKHDRYDSIIRELSGKCQGKGYHIIVTPCGLSHEDQKAKLRSLQALQVNVTVMIPCASEKVDPAEVMAEHKEKLALCPDLLCVDWQKDELVFDCVDSDERLLMELPLRHLKDMGHRFIGMIGACSPRRKTLLLETMEKLGMQETADTAMAGFLPVNLAKDDIPELVRSMLNRKPRPTALYCWSDAFAAIAYGICEREYGLKIGRDIAIVGQDDTVIATSLPVPLTSVDMRNADFASALFQLIELKIAGKSESAPARRIIEPKLIVRESSAFRIDN